MAALQLLVKTQSDQLLRLEADNQTLVQRCNASTDELASLQSLLNTKSDQLLRLETDNQALVERCSASTDELAALQLNLSTKSEHLLRLEADNQSLLQRCDALDVRLTEALDAHTVALAAKQLLAETADRQAEELRAEIVGLKARVQGLQAAPAPRSAVSVARADAMAMKLEQAETRRKLDDEDIRRKARLIASLQEQVAQLQVTPPAPPPPVDLQPKISMLESECARLRRKIAQLEREAAEVAADAAVSDWRKVVAEKDAEIERMRLAHAAEMRAVRLPVAGTEACLAHENEVLARQVREIGTAVYKPLAALAATMARMGKNADGTDDVTFQESVRAVVRAVWSYDGLSAREIHEHTTPIMNNLTTVYTRAAENMQKEKFGKALARAKRARE